MYGKRKAAISMSRGGAITIRNPLYQKSGPNRRSYRKRRQYRAGFARTSGYYGRFTGPAAELKFFDKVLDFQVDVTPEVSARLVEIPQGDTQSNRDGNKAFIKSINIHGTMAYLPAAAASASSGTVVYMYLIQDTQCNGADPTVSGANDGIFTTTDLDTAQRTIANSGRFKILKKWVVPFNASAGASTTLANVIKPFNFFKKCNIPIMYDASATTGAITTIRTNNLFIVSGVSGQLTTADDQVVVKGNCRVRFSDFA